jgi:hypothetical protein
MRNCSTPSAKWNRASATMPCPLCERERTCVWLGPADRPEVVVCFRKQSAVQAQNGLGWVHVFEDHRQPGSRPKVRGKIVPSFDPATFEALHRDCRDALDPEDVISLADELGISSRSLDLLELGAYGPGEVFTFPMRDGRDRVVGLRTRCPWSGAKRSISDSRSGLFFVPSLEMTGRHVLICEGPSDTAAAHD